MALCLAKCYKLEHITDVYTAHTVPQSWIHTSIKTEGICWKFCNRSHVKLITTSCQITGNYTVFLNLEHQENWIYNYFHKELKPKFSLPPKNERGVEWSKTSLLIVYYPYSISILRAKKIISIFKRHFKLIQAGTQNNCFTPTVYSI